MQSLIICNQNQHVMENDEELGLIIFLVHLWEICIAQGNLTDYVESIFVPSSFWFTLIIHVLILFGSIADPKRCVDGEINAPCARI